MSEGIQIIEIRLRAFGVLRKVADHDGYGVCSGFMPSTIFLIKETLKHHLQKAFPEFDASVVEECAFAQGTCILSDADGLLNLQELAILPPVCGG